MRNVLALVLLGATSLHAQKTSEVIFAGASSLAIVADCQLTKAALHRGPLYVEANPLLGRRPSEGRVNTFCGAALLTNLVAVPILFHHKGRLVAWALVFGVEGTMSGSNAITMGLRL